MARTAMAEELAAMRKIVGILDKLDTDVRERVIAWAHDRCNSAPTDADPVQFLVDADEEKAQDATQPVNTLTVTDDNPFGTTN